MAWTSNPPKPDVLYHLGFDSESDLSFLKDVRIVCMHGAASRAYSFAMKLKALYPDWECGDSKATDGELHALGAVDRYELYRVGPVISVSHGMGIPSVLILLHELVKLLKYAGTGIEEGKVTFVRLGTSGGLGVPPGTVVLTERALDDKLSFFYEHVELGRIMSHIAQSDPKVNAELVETARSCLPAGTEIVIGNTLCSYDFYEGQGRLDGAFDTWYTEADKMVFLRSARKFGVCNIEMESMGVLYFLGRLNIPRAVLCSTLLDREKGDQISATTAQLKEFTSRGQEVILAWIHKRVGGVQAK